MCPYLVLTLGKESQKRNVLSFGIAQIRGEGVPGPYWFLHFFFTVNSPQNQCILTYICSNGQGDINCSSLPAGLGGNVEFERKFERKKIRMESAWEESPQFMSPWSWVWGGGQFHRQRHPKWRQKWPDMEFVTSGTSGTCVKYFWARVKFSKINSKLSLKFADSGFNFHKKSWVSLYLSR